MLTSPFAAHACTPSGPTVGMYYDCGVYYEARPSVKRFSIEVVL
jgi:hypothetical protein